MSLLSVVDLVSGYGDLKVLNKITFEVNEGDFLAIIGPNGAGKTTLLKTIMGLLTPWNGIVNFDGIDITTMQPYKKVELGLALVPEGRGILKTLTVEENLILGAYTERAKSKSKDTLEWVFTLFPVLKERRHIMADRLSGGEQQMLAIARALMSQPKLLMIDEMSQGLAPSVVKNMFDVLEEIRNRVTLVVVEQRVKDVLKRANRAIILEHGMKVFEGSSEEILSISEITKHYLGT